MSEPKWQSSWPFSIGFIDADEQKLFRFAKRAIRAVTP